jgi:hypothetical protein
LPSIHSARMTETKLVNGLGPPAEKLTDGTRTRRLIRVVRIVAAKAR